MNKQPIETASDSDIRLSSQALRRAAQRARELAAQTCTAIVVSKPGPILAVEYKGADRWAGTENDRLIGGLWANMSGGRCRFVMIKDKRWEGIEEQLK